MTRETHEPDEPINWPYGHVSVTPGRTTDPAADRIALAAVAVTLTDDDHDECIRVTLGPTDHYLHSTTARALADELAAHNGTPVTITIHDIPHAASGPAARALRHALELRLTEWNQRPAAYGIPGV